MFVSWCSGWCIRKDGGSEFSNVTIRGTVYASSGEFRGTVYANDGDFQGTVYANKIVGNISESKMYPPFEQPTALSHTMNINYAGNPRLPVRLSIFFTINEYTKGTRFWVDGVEFNDRYVGKSYRVTVDLANGRSRTFAIRSSGSGRIVTSPIIAIGTPQGTGLS